QSDAASRSDVRVHRALDRHRDPADARFPRFESSVVRRPRQLFAGRGRADHLSGDRLRQDRSHPWARYRDHDDGAHQCGRPRAAKGFQLSFPRDELTMAKTSMVERERRRERLVVKYGKRRKELKAIIADRTVSDEERWNAQTKLQKLPRDSSPSRKKRRCGITGRPRGGYRKFGLARNKLREAAMRGDVPGLVKASW